MQRFVRWEIKGLLESDFSELTKDWLGEDDEYEDILAPAIEKLDDEAAEYLDHNIDIGTYYEATEQFSKVFSLSLANAEISEVSL